MKKLIKQDLVILLSLMGAYHPEAAAEIDREAEKLTMQGTRDYLFLLRDGQCRICPYADAFQPGGKDNQFWTAAARDPTAARAMLLHLIRVPRDSPEGSAVAMDYEAARRTVKRVCGLPQSEREGEIAATAHNALTRTRIASTEDFVSWMKGGTAEWR